MCAKLLCSANGRIRKIAFFDTTVYTLDKNETDPTRRIKPVMDNFRELIIDLSAFNKSIEFLVYYNDLVSETYIPEFCDQGINTTFIPVNGYLKSLYVPTRWVQDVVLIGPEEKLLYDANAISPSFAALLCQSMSLSDIAPFPVNEQGEEPIAGGDFLIGRKKKRQYILHSARGANEKLRTSFAIPQQDCVQDLSNTVTQLFSKMFFHVDYYCTLIGETDTNPDQETVLVAKPYVYNFSGLTDELDPPAPQTIVIDQNTRIDFNIVPLPMIVFLKDGATSITPDNVHFALSYNNCIVENYIDPDIQGVSKRNIRIYFPDFQDSLVSFVKEIYQKDNVSEGLMQLFNARYVDGRWVQPEAVAPWPTLQDAISSLNDFIQNFHFGIKVQMRRLGINDVHFVHHDFYQMAQRGGSLHCMAKVIQRDNAG